MGYSKSVKSDLALAIGRVFMLAVLLSPFQAEPQNANHPRPFACSYYGEEIDPKIKLSRPSAVAINIIQEIVSVVGLKPNFEIRASNVPNAAAVIVQGKRYILYNPEFISAINSASGTNWAGISIMAHEIGHHLNGHTLSNMGSRPDIELEADEFSGFVLNKLGARLSDAQAAMAIAANQKASHTHPDKQNRLNAIANGWKNATGVKTETASATKNAVVKPIVIENPVAEKVIAEKYIAFDVNFLADPRGVYYITVRGNLVKVENNSLYIVGRLGESNKKNYRLMLADKNYNYIYIAPSGKMVNSLGQLVGTIEKH